MSAFYHSDPVETWVVPWASRGSARGCRRLLAAAAGWLFYRIQRAYDVTIVTSRAMEGHLAGRGVSRLERIPLAVDQLFFASEQSPAATATEPNGGSVPPVASPTEQPPRRRLLFVGRLIADKAADLLWDALPEILRSGEVEVTVVGNGPYEQKFAAGKWPGYRYLPYVSGRQELAEIYRSHHILLAPGPYETFGLAVLEAMASGLVVVGPDRGGTAELLAETDSPLVFQAGDLADFIRVTAAACAADLAPLRRASLAAARRYGTWDEAIGRLMAFYEHWLSDPSALDGPRHAPSTSDQVEGSATEPTVRGRAA